VWFRAVETGEDRVERIQPGRDDEPGARLLRAQVDGAERGQLCSADIGAVDIDEVAQGEVLAVEQVRRSAAGLGPQAKGERIFEQFGKDVAPVRKDRQR
jgi:hypothetical protein